MADPVMLLMKGMMALEEERPLLIMLATPRITQHCDTLMMSMMPPRVACDYYGIKSCAAQKMTRAQENVRPAAEAVSKSGNE